MEKQKRWHWFLILAVIVLTFYNIFPTIFYYAKPLKKSIDSKAATQIASNIATRVNDLEEFTLSWIKAECKNLGLKPTKVSLDKNDPKIALVTFKNPKDAMFFSQTLARAGSLIPFVPAQLSPVFGAGPDENSVLVQRHVGIHFQPDQLSDYFQYVPKVTAQGTISPEYHNLVLERVHQLALGFGGESEPARILLKIHQNSATDEEVLSLAGAIVEYENAFSDQSPITQRFFESFTQVEKRDHASSLIQRFVAKLEQLNQNLNTQLASFKNEQKKRAEEGHFFDQFEKQRQEVVEHQRQLIQSALAIVRQNVRTFEQGVPPLTTGAIENEANNFSSVDLGNRNPFIKKLSINWESEAIYILLHKEVEEMRDRKTLTEAEAIQLEKLNQLLYTTIAKVARTSEETISPHLTHFVVSLNKLTNSSSLLTLNLGAVAKTTINTLNTVLHREWLPHTNELKHGEYPIYDFSSFNQLSTLDQKLGFVLYAPVTEKTPLPGFRNGSIYVIARGLNEIRQKYQDAPDSAQKTAFEKDFNSLQELLRQNGFIGYAATTSGQLPSFFNNDYIFELNDFYSYLLAATREDFSVKGNKRNAVLEFTDLEQRILTQNKIDTNIHEDLIKWRDAYKQAKVSVDPRAKYDVPPPTQSVLFSNLKLSVIKYFRGDDRKILKWGLDLSGGKTVRIGLRDHNHQPITDEADLKQAVNELYQRVNRLGVSEVGIRIEGANIVLDFPGSQGLSANDLIQASAMYFHIVNEKFSSGNPLLADAVNTFLDEIWSEAVITNRTDPENLNEIAWQHLGGSKDHPDEFFPLTNHAKLLYEHGLRFAHSANTPRSSHFDDTLSSIAVLKGSDFSDWQGQPYPLLIVFRNYALEGTNLSDVQTAYDPQEGNTLHFSVKGTYVNREGERISPRDDFYAWTSKFSEEKIKGTPLEAFSHGRGWRMAVVLNGQVVNAPFLNSPLRDNARITGHFSQREINQLAADLRAGSLSFTPHILSEENVSPDLGKEQRIQGISAAALGVILVIILICSYYRFSGVVASCAVIFNLLIIWAVLQNLGAVLTLPGIAGIILAIGMSVDANVLVFERIREEFAISRRLPSAIQAGYRKAFSAIVDSNLTTIIAALILLNFDSGPIKGFALTLIIGIVSSMFTALFMTRFFFAGWVQNPQHKELKMSRLFGQTKVNFLSKAKMALSISAIFILLGAFFLVKERHTLFGMDFTGGYALTITLQEKPGVNARDATARALEASGASASDFQIQELNKPTHLKLQLGLSMEQPGKPFFRLNEHEEIESPLFPYQNNPRIVWIVEALGKEGLQLLPETLPTLHLSWTEMSGQLSDTMRNQALIGLGLALLCILIYITFRFEFKYAISAVIGLAHDLLITLGLLALFHLFNESVRIDLQVIAALMTIIGYSLNDTIIIFDRIREDLKSMRKISFAEIVNHALNATLSRTVMTSGTTMIVLLALVLFGGSSIFNFSLIMLVGVAIGTLSSLYVAAPMLLYFQKRDDEKEKTSALKKI